MLRAHLKEHTETVGTVTDTQKGSLSKDLILMRMGVEESSPHTLLTSNSA